MVPVHAQERKEAFHEPRAKAGAPVLRSSATAEGGSSTHSKRCRVVPERLGLREAFGVRPACWRFPPCMIPMHAPKGKEALHEPQRRAGILPATVGNADGTEALALARSPGRRDPSSVAVLRRVDAYPTFGLRQFMVQMRGQKTA